jgi:outer membrane receptor protein involved in Fe transport
MKVSVLIAITICLIIHVAPLNAQDQKIDLATNNADIKTNHLLDVITVQPPRPDWESTLSPGAVDVVVPDDYTGEQKDLAAYLETVPGLHVNRRGGDGQYTTLTVRGSTSAQVNIYIDGVLQNLSGDAIVDLSLIPVKHVERIEVYRGYVPVRFSGAPIGGVVNIVTKKPQGLGGKVSAGVRSLGGREGDATLSFPLLGGSFLAGIHYDEWDGDFQYDYTYMTPQNKQNLPKGPIKRWRQSNGHENTDVIIKWQDDNWYFKTAWKKNDRYYPEPTNEYPLSRGSWSRIDLGIPKYLQNLTTLPAGYDYAQTLMQISEHRRQTVEQHDIQIGRRQTWGDLDWGVEYSYIDQNKKYMITNLPRWASVFNVTAGTFTSAFPVGSLWSTYKNQKHTLALDASYKLGQSNLVELRVDYNDETQFLDANQQGSMAGGGYRQESASLSPRRFPRFDHYERVYWRTQLADTITLGEDKNMWLTLVGRYESVEDNIDKMSQFASVKNEPTATWSVALKKDFSNNLTFRFTLGTYARYPTFYELYGDGVNIQPVDLFTQTNVYNRPKREKGTQWDVGIDWKGEILLTNTDLSLTYFERFTSDTIILTFVPVDGHMYYANGGDTISKGVEFEANFHWDMFDLFGQLTWLNAEYGSEGDSPPGTPLYRGEPGSQVILQPRWEWNLRGEAHLFSRMMTIFAENHYTGKMREERGYFQDKEGRIKRTELNVTNVGIRYETPWSLSFTVGINDLLDKRPDQKFILTNHEEQGLPYPMPGRAYYATVDYIF